MSGAAGRILRCCVPLLLAGALTACAEEPLPDRRISHDDCLAEVKLDQIKEAIARCDKVVAAFPQDPLPLNERFLLHTLAENDQAACRDIAQAAALAGRMPAAKVDPLLRSDLERRLADCRTAQPAATAKGQAQAQAARPQAQARPATLAVPASPPPAGSPPGSPGAPASTAAKTSPAIQQLPHQNR